MKDLAQLLIPAIRWSDERGYDGERQAIESALRLGVGGFILFGGTQDAVRALTRELRQRSRVPLLIAADMERGVGQQFAGATGLPPLAAIASLDDPEAIRRAARHTAREARTLGVNWDFAPVCDLDVELENPIVGTRSLGADPRRVSDLAAEWITACQAEGVLACAKHFPGHGRTRVDSHIKLPVVRASRQELVDEDIAPFRAAISAGVVSIMTAHVAYPALDPSGVAATFSSDMLRFFLRMQLGFDGLIVTDALTMGGALKGRTEEEAGVAALRAGCDVLLHPSDAEAMTRAVERARDGGLLDAGALAQSIRRRLKWAQWASPPNEYRRPSAADVAWCAQLADRVVHVVRGPMPSLGEKLHVVIVDDDAGGPHPPPSREPFLQALRDAGRTVLTDDTPPRGAPVVIALFGDVRSWKGRARYSAASLRAVQRAARAGASALVVQFGHPRLAAALPAELPVVSAWGGEEAMQQAAARFLARAD
ncbi:MAG TPA: glycoside hydrolase family 3 N-terminal domain-containing protein [Gemmatimonadaceae bacterium]|nr:glycoside hydrolase family 3 N-terminal domain-containing protein [Gemmatimonadaceae bacterium]